MTVVRTARRLTGRSVYLLRRWGTGLTHRHSRERTQALQVVKATAAAILAWWIAARLLHSQAGWLAPMTAVLMVQSTVYRSVAEGARRLVAVGVGVLLATGVGHLFGLSAIALVLVVPVALVLSRWKRIGAQSDYIPVTAVLLLTFGVSTTSWYLVTYVWETALGAGIGAVINTVVFPPSYLRNARTAVHNLGNDTAVLVRDLATAVHEGWDSSQADEWVERARDLDAQAREAREALRWSQESHRWNPTVRRHRQPVTDRAYFGALDCCWYAVIDVIGITRTMLEAADREERALIPDPRFRTGLSDLLDSAADTVASRCAATDDAAEPDTTDRLGASRSRLETMERRIEEGGVAAVPNWLLPGALLADVRRLLDHLR